MTRQFYCKRFLGDLLDLKFRVNVVLAGTRDFADFGVFVYENFDATGDRNGDNSAKQT